MRLFLSIAAIACGCGAAADPAKIIVDDTNKVDDRRWKPYDVRLHREERVHGEVVVLSPPLFVRGPPKGFPFRVRTRREVHGDRSDDGGVIRVSESSGHLRGNRAKRTASSLYELHSSSKAISSPLEDSDHLPLEVFRPKAKGFFRARRAGTILGHDFDGVRTKRAHASGRQNRLPDVYQHGNLEFYHPRSPANQHDYHPRNPSYYQPGRVQGEVVVHSSAISIKGPPKGYPLKRKARQVPPEPTNPANSTKLLTPTKPAQTPSRAASKTTKTKYTTAVKSKPVESPSTSVSSISTKPSNSKIDSLRGQGTKVKPKKGRHSMMKRLKKMWPYMLIPTMMTLGYAPFVLSSIKMFVMNALMLNMMAFNAAIMLTLRNMVFGPRFGGHTKYVNYGYLHDQHDHHGHHDDDRR